MVSFSKTRLVLLETGLMLLRVCLVLPCYAELSLVFRRATYSKEASSEAIERQVLIVPKNIGTKTVNIHEEKWNKQLGKLVQAITHIDTYFSEERKMWRVQGTLSPEYEGYIPECSVWNSHKGSVYTFWLKPPTEAEKILVANGIDCSWYALDDKALWYAGFVDKEYIETCYLHLSPEELALVKKDHIQITSGVIDAGSRYMVVVEVHNDNTKTTHKIKKWATFHDLNVLDIINEAEKKFGISASSVEAKVFLNGN